MQQPTRSEHEVAAFDFDRYWHAYEFHVDQSVRMSGESAKYFSNYKARYIARLLPETGKLLDFGCGIGMLSLSLQRHLKSWQIHGFDSSAGSIAAIDQRVCGKGKFSANLETLDDDYDAVVVANVLHHIAPVNRDVVLANIRERLSRRGVVFVIEHNPFNPLTRWAVSQCAFDDTAVLLWPSEVRERLRRIGLHTVRNDYIVFFPAFLRGLRALEPHLTWCPFGAQYTVVAEAPL